MTGWKTKAAALLSIIYGVAGWLLDLHGVDGMMDYVITGVGLVAVGHKIEKAGVALVPGSAFGCPDHIRISIATSMENLENAIKRIGLAL